MIIFDASYLIAYLHPSPEPPMDRSNRPVAKFRERINQLVVELNIAGEIIGVPTPALAEILVRAGKGKMRYLQTIGDAYRFEVLPFDQMAAIDAGELIEKIKKEAKQPLATWAKIKFDIQIAAIGKAVGATVIYSDDTDIETHGKRLNIPVKRICDLPIPPEPVEVPKKVAVEDEGQGTLFASPVAEDQNEQTGEEEAGEAIDAENPVDVRADAASGTGDASGAKTQEPIQAQIPKAPEQPNSKVVMSAPAPEKPKPAKEGGRGESGS